MSLPEYIQHELKVYKPKLKFELGELVVDTKEKKKKPLVIAGFLPFGAIEDEKADYICCRLTSQGNREQHIFREKELKTMKQ